jgi:hypothetical protein
LVGATLTFIAGAQRSVTRTGVVLQAFDPMSSILTINDGGQMHQLNLSEWTRVLVTLQQPSPTVQAPMPLGMPITSVSGQQYKLSTMNVLDGVVSFGDCQSPSGPGEIRFGGELAFDPQNDTLVISGTFWRYEFPSGPAGNPGVSKGGIP